MPLNRRWATFEQTGGTFTTDSLYVGTNWPDADGTYLLSGGTFDCWISVIGAGGIGLVEQTGGTFTQTGTFEEIGVMLGWANTGTYNMRGRQLNADYISVGLDGDAYFTQSGGVVDVSYNLRIGLDDPNIPMLRTSMVEYAPGLFYMCNFTNNSSVQMGNTTFDGGTFVGHMTNYGWFNYAQGDFSASTLTNYGTIYLIAPFTCNRLVQNAYSFTVTPTTPITATGTGYADAFESNGNLTIEDGATITVVNAPLVSNEAMYAGGSVTGDVENNDYLLPATGSDTMSSTSTATSRRAARECCASASPVTCPSPTSIASGLAGTLPWVARSRCS